MIRSISLALPVLLALALPSPSQAMHPERCPDGTYFVDGPPIFPNTLAAARDAIVIDHGTVAITSGCPAVPASIHKGRDGSWYVRARWRQCGNSWRVHLRARIEPGCAKMGGVVSSARPRMLRRFLAARCEDPAGCQPVCRDNAGCPDFAYCAKPEAACDGPGRCAERPAACPDVWLPVCGCDGKTYSNGCDAAAAGVNVAHPGECIDRCGADQSCPPGTFCEAPPGACKIDPSGGTCTALPDTCVNDFCGNCEGRICPLCPNIWQPVCGCDGVTYATDCERRKAQVSKAHDGPCLCPQILCAPGTEPVDRDGDGCAESCLAPCGTACDCRIDPNIQLGDDCPLLCATCGNYWACEAGHCVDRCGPMPIQECRICGGIAGFPCGPREVCDLPPGQCSSADLFGICKPAPDACITLWDPVCGCDGVTYGNDCERLRAGAQKAYDGECRKS